MKNFLTGSKSILLGAFLSAACLPAIAAKPNIIYIMADDQSHAEISAYNSESPLITPNIDALAAEGLLFQNAYSASSVCTPSRYATLTGRYAWRTYLQSRITEYRKRPLITDDVLSVPEFLKDNGYTTLMLGKWHIGSTFVDEDNNFVNPKETDGPVIGLRLEDGPIDFDFDYYYGFYSSRSLRYFVENDRLVEEVEDYDALPKLMNKSIDLIEQHATEDKPFLLFIALNAPHTPIAPSAEWVGSSGLGAYGDFVLQTDYTVGQIVNAVDAAGIRDETMIIYTSDNGTSHQAGLQNLRDQGFDPIGGLRGSKGNLWEGGTRIPYIVSWPELVPKNTISRNIISSNNLLATLSDILDVPLPKHQGVDSFSIYGNLVNGKSKTHSYVIHHSWDGSFAIRSQRYKFIATGRAGGLHNTDFIDELPFQLYNMREDEAETTNILLSEEAQYNKLSRSLERIVRKGRSTRGRVLENEREVVIWRDENNRKTTEKPEVPF